MNYSTIGKPFLCWRIFVIPFHPYNLIGKVDFPNLSGRLTSPFYRA